MGTTQSTSSVATRQQHQPVEQQRAAESLTSNRLKFHSTIIGDNIVLQNSGHVAKRAESFCKGICFSNRPVAVNEQIIIKVKETSTNWSGVLRIGFTSNNPEDMRNTPLPRYACPDLTNKPGFWAKALNERYAETNTVLCFSVTHDGSVIYKVNGTEKGVFFPGVNVSSPIWVMVDLYGNTIAIEMNSEATAQRTPSSGCGEPMNEHPRPVPTIQNRVSNVPLVTPPIRYHTDVRFSPFPLSSLYGRNIKIMSNGKAAVRTDAEYCQGYVFMSRPLRVDEKIVVQVLGTDLSFVGGLCFGMTSCNPATINASNLPDDSDQLLDRPEYWVVNKDVCNTPDVGDELSFAFMRDGKVIYKQNNHRAITLMHVDVTVPLYPFFDIYGNISKVCFLGITSTGLSNNVQSSDLRVQLPPSEPSSIVSESTTDRNVAKKVEPPPVDDSTNECTVCYENQVDTVLYTCGHMCMCFLCAQKMKASPNPYCPICRMEIQDVIKAYKSC